LNASETKHPKLRSAFTINHHQAQPWRRVSKTILVLFCLPLIEGKWNGMLLEEKGQVRICKGDGLSN